MARAPAHRVEQRRSARRTAVSAGTEHGDGAVSRRGPLLVAEALTRVYGRGQATVRALDGVSLELDGGVVTAVMGPSGSGKSTLMHVLAGLDRPTSGRVLLDGVELTALGERELTLLRRARIGFVFQFFNLLPMLTAEENILLPLGLAGRRPDREWLADLLEAVGLEHRRRHRPAELSGGEQQRVAIARALVTRPAVVFADEPTGNLDSHNSSEILELLHACSHRYEQTVVMVTHEPRVASIADRILLLADGKLARDLGEASVEQVLAALAELGAGR